MKEYTWKVRGLMTPTQKTSTGERIYNVCSGVVNSVEEGEEIIKMFNQIIPANAQKGVGCFVTGDEPAFLDYKPNDWIQVKVCISMEHFTALQVLYVICSKDNLISEKRVKICRNQELVDLIMKEYYKYISMEDDMRKAGLLFDLKRIKKDMHSSIDSVIEEYYKLKGDEKI